MRYSSGIAFDSIVCVCVRERERERDRGERGSKSEIKSSLSNV